MNTSDFIEREKGIVGKSIEIVKDAIPTSRTKKLEKMALGIVQHKNAGLLSVSEADRFEQYIADQAGMLGIQVTVDDILVNLAKLTKKEENVRMLSEAYGKNVSNGAYRRATRNLHFLGLGRGKNLPRYEEGGGEQPPEQIPGLPA